MDWILDNLQIVIAIAGAIAYWLNARSKEKAGEPADYDGDGEPDTLPGGGRTMRDGEREMEQAEATRRIQEEIRRKIAERAGQTGAEGGGWTPPEFEPQPLPPPMPPRRREPELAPHAREARREETEREAALVLERQRGLAEQYAALKARKVEAGREAKSVWAAEVSPVRTAVVQGRKKDDLGLLAELRNARSLKKAIVLREVLGAPVALR
jgi:hypothetical protein